MKLFRPLVAVAMVGATALVANTGSAQTAPPTSTPPSTTTSTTVPTTTIPPSLSPVLTVDKTRVKPGEVLTFTLYSCDIAPQITVQILDQGIPTLADLDVSGEAPVWTATYTAGNFDLSAYGACRNQLTDRFLIDVDFPTISFDPPNALRPFGVGPTMVYGTDCPPGTTAQVDVDLTNPDGTTKDVNARLNVAIDDDGDWQTAIPGPQAGETVTVAASCGDVVYDVLTETVPIRDAVLPPATNPPPSTPPPASPRRGSPSFTG